MKINAITLAILAATVAAPARADVVAAEANGFQVKGQVTIAASRETVWPALLDPNGWWSPSHRWFDGSTMTLDPRPGGCWCETGPDGAGAKHLEIGLITRPETLQMTGGLGPLQGMGLDGVLTIKLASVEGGTTVDWTYTVTGWAPSGIALMAAPVDGVLTEQMGRLKALIED